MIINYELKIKKTVPISIINLKKIIKTVCRQIKYYKKFEISIIVVGDKKIKQLNQQYRKINKITDVLSFQTLDPQFVIPGQNKDNYLGDIFICFDQVKRQARELKVDLKNEFSLLVVHGFLHLLGYDHQTDVQYKKMKNIEDKVLSKLYD